MCIPDSLSDAVHNCELGPGSREKPENKLGRGCRPYLSYRSGATSRYHTSILQEDRTKSTMDAFQRSGASLGCGRQRGCHQSEPLNDHSLIHRDVKEMRKPFNVTRPGKGKIQATLSFNDEEPWLGQKTGRAITPGLPRLSVDSLGEAKFTVFLGMGDRSSLTTGRGLRQVQPAKTHGLNKNYDTFAEALHNWFTQALVG